MKKSISKSLVGQKKLNVARESVRVLSSASMSGVAGGDSAGADPNGGVTGCTSLLLELVVQVP